MKVEIFIVLAAATLSASSAALDKDKFSFAKVVTIE